MNLPEARKSGFQILRSYSDTPALDTRIILGWVTGLSQGEILTSEAPLTPAQVMRFMNALQKRCSGQSVAYIVGRKEFYGHDFAVGPGVLVPRPETEILVEAALEFLRGIDCPSVLDICTGCGCIGISLKSALASEGRACALTLSDISPQALRFARRNCRQIIGNDAKCVKSDLFGAFEGCRFNLITANPPYIDPREKSMLAPEVLCEPPLALFAGDFGMEVLARIAGDGPGLLENGGLLLVECGCTQASDVRGLMEKAGLGRCFVLEDLGGRPRCVGGYRDA